MIETIIIALAVLLDRVTKLWAKDVLFALPTQTIDVLPGIVEFRYTENTGAAFSLLSGQQGLFIILTVAMVALMIFYLVRYRQSSSLLMKISVASIMGGALGNFVDRLFCGFVIDFINPTFMKFAVFNVADIFVTCGTALFVLAVLLMPKTEAKYAKK